MTPEELEAKKAALAQLSIDPEKAAQFHAGFSGEPAASTGSSAPETTHNQQSFFQSLHDALLGPSGEEEKTKKPQ